MPAGLGSPDIAEYHGRHADRESACGLCSPGRQQRGDTALPTHVDVWLRSTGSSASPICMHELHHTRLVDRDVLHVTTTAQNRMWTIQFFNQEVRDDGNG